MSKIVWKRKNQTLLLQEIEYNEGLQVSNYLLLLRNLIYTLRDLLENKETLHITTITITRLIVFIPRYFYGFYTDYPRAIKKNDGAGGDSSKLSETWTDKKKEKI